MMNIFQNNKIPLYKIDNRSELNTQIKHGDLIWIRQEKKLMVFDNGKLSPLAIKQNIAVE